jgi:excinuclease ABC subunit A
MQFIKIRGARQHNLKNLNIDIPRNQLVVVTGVSGSGKSTLAFDILYAEGQRRYVESLSTYARHFLERMQKPQVELIEGLSPAIAIDQKASSHNPRSTVGTITEIYDYLRLLYARVGLTYCPRCDQPISSQSVDQMIERLMAYPEGTRMIVLAPLVRGVKGDHGALLRRLQREGYARVRINGQMRDIGSTVPLPNYEDYTIEAVVDRVVIKSDVRSRLADSVELALSLSQGSVLVDLPSEKPSNFCPPILFSTTAECPICSFRMPEIDPACFSFNSPQGACPACAGSGAKRVFDPKSLIRDPALSLEKGAIRGWAKRRSADFNQFLNTLARQYGADIHTPFQNLPEVFKTALFYGTDHCALVHPSTSHASSDFESFEGLIPLLQRRYRQAATGMTEREPRRFTSLQQCPDCRGARIRLEARSVKINSTAIHEVAALPVDQALLFFRQMTIEGQQAIVAERVIREIILRLEFLKNVGLSYLSLDRSVHTLSGGELQRIRLATQICARLTGVLYVLDEPSVGLHQRDHRMMLETLLRLRDMGNTVLVVEHDCDTIMAADHVIELGPGAGAQGGRVVFSGPPQTLLAANTLTGQYLSGRRKIATFGNRRSGNGRYIRISGAAHHNLKSIQVDFQLGCLTCVTGVSGSGKSTLVIDTLFRALAQYLYRTPHPPGRYDAISGMEQIDKVINIDASPIGRSPRSNPVTFTGLFSLLRELYSKTPDARIRGYKAGRFSFNSPGGRCEACRGEGVVKVEMHFLPDIYVLCEVCRGRRYNRETLQVRFKGHSVADILEMTVEQAMSLFEHIGSIRERLRILADVGLGYIQLGQAGTTLSGGEAQRVKLARELCKPETGRTVYILDEPTTGLHLHDIHHLMLLLNRLVDAGNTVIMIEHNPDAIKTADWVIDLGPEGGPAGGYLIGAGTPEEISALEASHTGRCLATVLSKA